MLAWNDISSKSPIAILIPGKALQEMEFYRRCLLRSPADFFKTIGAEPTLINRDLHAR